MSDPAGSQWGVLALAGVLGVCCIGLAGLAGGAALVGGSAAGLTAATGAVGGIGGLVVTGLATALPLLVIGLFIRRRANYQ